MSRSRVHIVGSLCLSSRNKSVETPVKVKKRKNRQKGTRTREQICKFQYMAVTRVQTGRSININTSSERRTYRIQKVGSSHSPRSAATHAFEKDTIRDT